VALRGDVGSASDAFARAMFKGSGAGAYLAVILNAFLEPALVHHRIRNDVLPSGSRSCCFTVRSAALAHDRANLPVAR